MKGTELIISLLAISLVDAVISAEANDENSPTLPTSQTSNNAQDFEFFTPLDYTLTLELDFKSKDNVQCVGSVLIYMEINSLEDGTSGKEISLNVGRNVKIEEITYFDEERVQREEDTTHHDYVYNSVAVESAEYDDEREMLDITLNRYTTSSNGQLMIKFSSKIPILERNGQGLGYLLAPDQSLYIVSDFSDGGAKQVFPFFDLDDYKNSFQLEIITDIENKILSPGGVKTGYCYTAFNQPSSSSDPLRCRSGVIYSSSFAPDKFAFIVGRFEELVESSNEFINFKALTPVFENPNVLRGAVEIANSIVKILEEYIQRRLPAVKDITLVGLPTTYPLETKTYPGFMVANMNDLKIDDPEGSRLNRMMAIRLVSSFIIRESMGNIHERETGMKVGLMTLLQAEIIHLSLYNREPDYFAPFNVLNYALELDSTTKSISINDALNNKSMLGHNYARYKAAAVLRMFLADLLLVRTSMNRIISLFFQASSMEPQPTDSSGGSSSANPPISNIETLLITLHPRISLESLRDWFEKPGMPTIYMSASSDELTLKQRRLVLDEHQADAASMDDQWVFPVTYTLSDGRDLARKSGYVWFDKNVEHATVQVNLPDWYKIGNPFHFIKLNHRMQGYYRVIYPIQMIERMQMAISKDEMNPMDRLDMLTNVGLMWQADLIDSLFFVRFLSWFRYEDPGMVIESLVHWFKKVLKRFIDVPIVYEALEEFGVILFNRLYKRYGFELKSVTSCQESSLVEVYKLLITLRYDRLIADALQLSTQNPSNIPQLNRALILAAVSGYPNITPDMYYKTINSNFKDHREENIVMFGATMLLGDSIPYFGLLLERSNFLLYARYMIALMENGQQMQYTMKFLLNQLMASDNPQKFSSICEVFFENATGDLVGNLISKLEGSPQHQKLHDHITQLYLKRQNMSMRDGLSIVSFFNQAI